MKISKTIKDITNNREIKVAFMPLNHTGYLVKNYDGKKSLLVINSKYKKEFIEGVKKSWKLS